MHPSTGREIRVLRGPYGWYLEMALAPEDAQQEREDVSSNGATTGKRKRRPKAPKPQRVSLGKLPAGQVPEITLEEAVELLQWPKVLPQPSCRIFLIFVGACWKPRLRDNGLGRQKLLHDEETLKGSLLSNFLDTIVAFSWLLQKVLSPC